MAKTTTTTLSEMLNFKSKSQNLLVQSGKIIDDKSREFIRNALGLKKKKVESKRHSILSGPPGVGKSFGTIDECNNANIVYLLIPPGTSDIELACRMSYGVYGLKPGEELVVILDDADDVVFGNYDSLNKWKIAMAAADYDLGSIPTFNHAVSMTNTINTLEKQGKTALVEALRHFQSPDSVGISIPTDRVRFIILCNLDLEDPKAFRGKLKTAVGPVLDRMNYKRMSVSLDEQWGWTAYVLGNTQPFKEYPLTPAQKIELLQWMYAHKDNLRSTSYRTVRKLAEDMINDPDNYMDAWSDQLKGH